MACKHEIEVREENTYLGIIEGDTVIYNPLAPKNVNVAGVTCAKCGQEWDPSEVEAVSGGAVPTIYKIRYIVQESKRGGGFADVKRVDEKVVYGNLDRAREIYQEYLNDAQGFEQYRKYSVILELFTPHIHENGELAYWPDNESYIERHRTQGR